MFQQHRFVAEMIDTSFMRVEREDPETIIGSSTTQHLSLWSDRWLYSLRLREMVVNAWREYLPVSPESKTPAPPPPPSKSESLSRNCSYNCTKVNACYCCCQPARTAVLSDRQTNAFIRMSANALLGFRDNRYTCI